MNIRIIPPYSDMSFYIIIQESECFLNINIFLSSPVLDLDVMELPRQNNLPLQTNRQRASKSPVQRLPTKPGYSILIL